MKNLQILFVCLLVCASSLIAGAAQASTSMAESTSGSTPVPGTSVTLSWSLEGDAGKSAFNPDKVQKIIVQLRDNSGKPLAAGVELTGFDARMPEHNHGMVTKPVIKKISASEYAVDGVKLHMSGKWVLEFKVSDKSVKFPVEIK
ncbi:hypothetical protein EBZ80_05660 [bacterium]|nr:hypothetical protein [bacterium]